MEVNSEIVNSIKQYWFFDGCNEDDIFSLLPYFKGVTLKKDSIVYSEDEKVKNVYIINEGCIEIGKNIGSNKYYRLSLLRKGNIFGTGEIFHKKYYVNAKTKDESQLLAIDVKDFIKYFLTLYPLNINIMNNFADIVRRYTTICEWGNTSVDKLILYLNYLTGEYGKESGNSIIIDTSSISYNTISEILNISKEHVFRLFLEFKNEGVVEISRNKITIDKYWITSTVNTKKNDQRFYNNLKFIFDF